MRKLADVGARDESLVAGARQNDAAYRGIVPGVLEGLPHIRPRRRIERVEDLRAIYGDISNIALLRIEDVCERQARRFHSHDESPVQEEGEPRRGSWLAFAHTN